MRSLDELTGFISRLRYSLPILLRAFRNRAELAAIEVEEAVGMMVFLSVCGIVSAILFFLATSGVTLLVAAIFWDTPYRVAAIGIVIGVELLGMIGVVLWMCIRWRRWIPFQDTRNQIKEDSKCLSQVFQKHGE